MLFHLVELNSPADGVRGAAAQVALIVNGRAKLPKIDIARESAQDLVRRSVDKIAVIGQIGRPAIPGKVPWTDAAGLFAANVLEAFACFIGSEDKCRELAASSSITEAELVLDSGKEQDDVANKESADK